MWHEYDETLTFDWESAKLRASDRMAVPAECGIYSLILDPHLGGHPHCTYLMYVGQTTSLKRRFGTYLTTERRKRSKVSRLLNDYDAYIYFCFTRLPFDRLNEVEDALSTAYLPSCNSKFKGIMQQVVDAF